MLMVWLLVLFAIILAGFFAVTMLRRYIRSDDSDIGGETFTLGDLRSMLQRGQITQEEYDRLREQIISTVRKPTEKPDKPPESLRPTDPPQV